MQRTFFRPDPAEAVQNQRPLSQSDIETAIQDIISTLAEIDGAYDERRSALRSLSRSESAKMKLLNKVDALHRKEREPHVKRLAELHWRAMSETLFRTKH
jgi:hypothetical protein